jgi:hypothetical protein
MNAKNLLVAGALGLTTLFAAGTGTATAGPYYYHRPIVGRPIVRGAWVPPAYPYVYTYPAPAYYTYPAYTYPVTTGVYVGAPGIRIGIGR